MSGSSWIFPRENRDFFFKKRIFRGGLKFFESNSLWRGGRAYLYLGDCGCGDEISECTLIQKGGQSSAEQKNAEGRSLRPKCKEARLSSRGAAILRRLKNGSKDFSLYQDREWPLREYDAAFFQGHSVRSNFSFAIFMKAKFSLSAHGFFCLWRFGSLPLRLERFFTVSETAKNSPKKQRDPWLQRKFEVCPRCCGCGDIITTTSFG